eukprot:gb/GECG01012703.1/.p1 GENE.gb/GECG01012703.1/~~gb/GECG01012703.1/.p1  ORF type:complete len:564 (+),score=49.42 gb/GECG01012703.1/:1-1692(+)
MKRSGWMCMQHYIMPLTTTTRTNGSRPWTKGEEDDHQRFELKRLELIRMNIVSIPSYAWKDMAFKTLRELDLSRNQLVRVPAVAALVNLRSLKLYYNGIQGWTDIAALGHNQNLAHLDLRVNPCSNRPGYIEYILRNVPQLSMLDGVDIATHKTYRENLSVCWTKDAVIKSGDQTSAACLEQYDDDDETVEETTVHGTGVVFGHNDFNIKCPVRAVVRRSRSQHQTGRSAKDSVALQRKALAEKNPNHTFSCSEEMARKGDYDDIACRVQGFRKVREEVLDLFSDTVVGRRSSAPTSSCKEEVFPHWTNNQFPRPLRDANDAHRQTPARSTDVRSSSVQSSRINTCVCQDADVRGLIRQWPGSGIISTVDSNPYLDREPMQLSLTVERTCQHSIQSSVANCNSSLSIENHVESDNIVSSLPQTAEKGVGPTAFAQEQDISRIKSLEAQVAELQQLAYSRGQNTKAQWPFLRGQTRVVVPSRPLPRPDESVGSLREAPPEPSSKDHGDSGELDGFANWKEKYYHEENLWRHNFFVLKSHYEKAIRRLMSLQGEGLSASSSSNTS